MHRKTSVGQRKDLIRIMFKEVFVNPTYDHAAIERYFDPEYMQTVDGNTLFFDQFCQHVRLQKQTLRALEIQFKTLAEEGDVVFSNHVARAETVEGRKGEIHVLAEFRFLEDKIVACDELSRMLSGDPQDGDIGSRH